MSKTKECAVCGQEFEQKQTGRLRITRKKDKGEDVVWLCPDCSRNVSLKDEGGHYD